jgi:hypothetical protein
VGPVDVGGFEASAREGVGGDAEVPAGAGGHEPEGGGARLGVEVGGVEAEGEAHVEPVDDHVGERRARAHARRGEPGVGVGAERRHQLGRVDRSCGVACPPVDEAVEVPAVADEPDHHRRQRHGEGHGEVGDHVAHPPAGGERFDLPLIGRPPVGEVGESASLLLDEGEGVGLGHGDLSIGFRVLA